MSSYSCSAVPSMTMPVRDFRTPGQPVPRIYRARPTATSRSGSSHGVISTSAVARVRPATRQRPTTRWERVQRAGESRSGDRRRSTPRDSHVPARTSRPYRRTSLASLRAETAAAVRLRERTQVGRAGARQRRQAARWRRARWWRREVTAGRRADQPRSPIVVADAPLPNVSTGTRDWCGSPDRLDPRPRAGVIWRSRSSDSRGSRSP